MYDKRENRTGRRRSVRGKTGTAASAGWVLMFLAISMAVAWVELREDPQAESVIPEESACLHPHICVG